MNGHDNKADEKKKGGNTIRRSLVKKMVKRTKNTDAGAVTANSLNSVRRGRRAGLCIVCLYPCARRFRLQ